MGGPLALVLAAAVPTLIVSLYFDWLDRERPEPRSSLRRVYLAGALSFAPVLVVELLLRAAAPEHHGVGGIAWDAFVVAAIPEEAAKVACIAIFVWKRAAFDEHMDGITYGVRAGLGFALVENLGYFLVAPPDQLLVVLVFRSALLVPGHAAWGAIAGYWAARRRFSGDGIGAFGGWICAVVLHGAYDFCIFSIVGASGEETLRSVLAFSAALLVLLGSIIWMRRLAALALASDDQLDEAIMGGSSTSMS
ncbi:MAG: PrsW family intramembrane metalloprotease, partial [Nannocystaceae bacterium]